MNITEVILDEVARSGMTPMAICETPARAQGADSGPNFWFASRVVELMGGRSMTTFDTTGEDLGEHLRQSGQKHDIKAPNYCFIVHEGRVYDAATPFGVEAWDQLPWFRARGYKASNYTNRLGQIIKEDDQ
jgi:hypothetical protein